VERLVPSLAGQELHTNIASDMVAAEEKREEARKQAKQY
jgi:hypothetical protein